MHALRIPLLLLAAAAAIYLLQQARPLLLPLALAIFFSLLLGRPVAWLTRRRVPRMLAALLVTLGFAGGAALGLGQFVEPLEKWSAKTPEALNLLQQHGEELRQRLQQLSTTQAQVQALAEEVVDEGRSPVKVELDEGDATKQAAGYLLAMLYGFMVTMLLLFFLLAKGHVLLRRLLQLPASRAVRRRGIHVARAVEHYFYRYLVTITLVNAGLAVVTATMLTLLGVPDPWLWGALAGVLNYAPYIGTVISASAITVAASLSQESLIAMLAPGALYVAINGAEAGLLTPALLGERLSLNPLFVLLAILFFGWLWGVAGMFVAVPALVIGKVVLTEFGGAARPWARVLAG